jgi:hypothetical protein
VHTRSRAHTHAHTHAAPPFLALAYAPVHPHVLCAPCPDGLKGNTHLRALSLERNPLTGEDGTDMAGVSALAAALAANTTLVSLSLFDCGLGVTGGRILADGVVRNTTLVGLQVRG